jgi:23S rRNA (cytosine1962-C5)-methyltransferase
MSARVLIPDRLAGHVLKGHPWVYADILPPGPPIASTGELVMLVGRDGKPLGQALFDAGSPIALRVLNTRRDDVAGPSLWRRRVRDALALRRSTLDLSATDAFRLLHGEGDLLPGVVVDHYAGWLVMKLDTAAWLPHLDDLVAALEAEVQPRGIYLKGLTGRKGAEDGGAAAGGEARVLAGGEARVLAGGEARVLAGGEARVLAGAAPPEDLVVLEYGMQLRVDVYRGQKTGFFLDQRENRALVRRVARGREVLNLFSYTGGFSLAAALGGATRVASVDIARGAVEGARENFALNGVDPEAHEFVAQDAFEYLSRCAQERRQFDLVVVDPPSFAPNERVLRKALSAYVKLNEKAIRQVRPGGLLASASCSSHVTQEAFLQALREAAAEARRPLRLLEVRQEPADHPTPLHFPEGRYLKFVLAVAG